MELEGPGGGTVVGLQCEDREKEGDEEGMTPERRLYQGSQSLALGRGGAVWADAWPAACCTHTHSHKGSLPCEARSVAARVTCPRSATRSLSHSHRVTHGVTRSVSHTNIRFLLLSSGSLVPSRGHRVAWALPFLCWGLVPGGGQEHWVPETLRLPTIIKHKSCMGAGRCSRSEEGYS